MLTKEWHSSKKTLLSFKCDLWSKNIKENWHEWYRGIFFPPSNLFFIFIFSFSAIMSMGLILPPPPSLENTRFLSSIIHPHSSTLDGQITCAKGAYGIFAIATLFQSLYSICIISPLGNWNFVQNIPYYLVVRLKKSATHSKQSLYNKWFVNFSNWDGNNRAFFIRNRKCYVITLLIFHFCLKIACGSVYCLTIYYGNDKKKETTCYGNWFWTCKCYAESIERS